MNNRKVLALMFVCALHCAAVSGASQDIYTLMLRNHEINIQMGDAPAAPITYDGIRKALPAWSPDGERIAFVESSESGIEFARLVVVNRTGQTVSAVDIRPSEEGMATSGVRYLESIQWPTNRTIVVSGSVNPSTREYIVFDLESGKNSVSFFDDAKGAGFSPNGQRYAYFSGMPHFTPISQTEPTLIVDDTTIAKWPGGSLAILATPLWSSNSRQVAVLTRDRRNNEYNVIVVDASTSILLTLPLPQQSDDSYSLYWLGNNLYATRDPQVGRPLLNVFVRQEVATKSWLILPDPAGSTELADGELTKNPVMIANALKKQLAQRSARLTPDGTSFDFWCDNCALMVLPRRSSTQE